MRDKSKEERERVCKLYKQYFNKIINNDMDNLGAKKIDRKLFIEELRKIYRIIVFGKKKVVLGCWCCPLQCHGEVIVEFINGFIM